MNDISRIAELIAKGEHCCLATVIASDNPDIPVGSKVIVFEDGTMEGSVGSVPLDEAVRDRARETLARNKKRAVAFAAGMEVFFDILSADVKLLICGAGHIAVPLARSAREVGFKVTVIDDRADFAHADRFPGCAVLASNFAAALRTIPLDASTYVVVITRGHEHDVECLTEILPQETAYVGLIGSRRRVHFVLDMLGEKGIPARVLMRSLLPSDFPSVRKRRKKSPCASRRKWSVCAGRGPRGRRH